MRAMVIASTVALGGLTLYGCGIGPDYVTNGEANYVLLMTGINQGVPLRSDVRPACPDSVALRLENHSKNPAVADTAGFRGDMVVERYEVRYFRSDGRSTQGVHVPYTITGNVAQEVRSSQAETLSLEVVRAQAKLEPPLSNLARTGGQVDVVGAPGVITMFAEVTLHARMTTGQTTNSVSARLQIDFGDYGSFNDGVDPQATTCDQ